MIRYILLPIIIALGISALIYFGGISAEFGKFEMLTIALLSFCALLTLYNYFKVNFSLFQRSERWSGITDIEREFNEKIIRLEKRHGGQNGYHLHTERIRELEGEIKKILDSEYSEENIAKAQGKSVNAGDNVVSLDNVIKKRAGSDRRRPQQDEEENIPKGLSIDKHFALYLNPIYEIPDREVVALEAVFGLHNSKNGQKHVFRQNGLTLSTKTSRKIVRASVEAAGDLMEEMNRVNERITLIFDITGAIKDNDTTWDTIFNILRKNSTYHEKFIAQIKMSVYLKMSENQKGRFAALREIGIPICISECRGINNTIKAVESGAFECATVAAAELVRFGTDKKEQFIEKIQPIAKDHDLKIIATQTNSEEHIVIMLDNELEMVQGSLLSQPILAKTNTEKQITEEVS